MKANGKMLPFVSFLVLLFVAGCATNERTPSPASAPPPPPTPVAATPPAPAPPATPAVDPKSFRSKPPVVDVGVWEELFDGKSLNGWVVTPFAGHGEVDVKNDAIHMDMGAMLTGVHRTNDLPRMNYEISVQAMKVSGSDFFCGLTFPVNDACCSLIVGGWGGGLVGISSLDGNDASSNETTKFLSFEAERWYHIRVRVTPNKLEAWIDDDRVVNADIKDRRISMRPGEIELSQPFGIATYQTHGALKSVKIHKL